MTEPMVNIPPSINGVPLDCRDPEQKAGIKNRSELDATGHQVSCVMRYGAILDGEPIDPKDCPCNRHE